MMNAIVKARVKNNVRGKVHINGNHYDKFSDPFDLDINDPAWRGGEIERYKDPSEVVTSSKPKKKAKAPAKKKAAKKKK